MTRAWSALLGLAIAAPFYWLLIDTTSSPELYAGGAAAVLAAGAYSAAYIESTKNAAIRLRWLGFAVREMAKVPRGIATVCAEVLSQAVRPRPRRGVIQIEPFHAGSGEPHDLGRWAITEASRSFAPNTIVIGVDPESGRLLLHRIGGRR
jgi:multisubunit Na+/H+ antiporter MnhE subunit